MIQHSSITQHTEHFARQPGLVAECFCILSSTQTNRFLCHLVNCPEDHIQVRNMLIPTYKTVHRLSCLFYFIDWVICNSFSLTLDGISQHAPPQPWRLGNFNDSEGSKKFFSGFISHFKTCKCVFNKSRLIATPNQHVIKVMSQCDILWNGKAMKIHVN